ncbi:MAG: hypothetical protein GX596_00035 [Propionibacterium sp.]|nr:hypothetical protein [Propionibacterium sp.]
MSEVIQYNVTYFRNHQQHWYDVSERLAEVKNLAVEAEAPDGALWSTLVPGFKETHDHICGLIIESLLQRGTEATKQMGDMLEQTARAYAAAEAENTATADRILDEVGFD